MKRSLFSAITLAAIAMLAAGCIVETGPTHGPSGAPVDYYAPTADLEVTWRLSGSQSTSMCDYYGVGTWSVEVRGTEARDVTIDCRGSWWTTESDLHMLLAGSYTITLRAFDDFGASILARGTSVNLVASGMVTEVEFSLVPSDFFF